jgi:mevalonate kinase
MDWLGYSVITASIDMKIFCEATLNSENRCEIFSYEPYSTFCEYSFDEPEIDEENDLKYSQAVIQAIKKQDSNLPGISIRFFKPPTSSGLKNLISGKGLSSSAALGVATASGVYLISKLFNEQDKSLEDVCAETAYVAEHDILGINCGRMDPYACSRGGVLKIDCSVNPVGINRYKGISGCDIIVGDSKKVKDTGKILGWLKERYQSNETNIARGVENIRGLVEKGDQILSSGDISASKLGALMNLNQKSLREDLLVSGECPLSPSSLDDLVDASLDSGAYGAKVSGSGGGGCIIALCNPRRSKKVMRAIEDVGGVAYGVKPTSCGLEREWVT